MRAGDEVETMKILALYASKNQHGKDATGAFIPQAKLFSKRRATLGDEVELVPFDPTIADRAKRRAAFLDLIRAAGPYDALAYFGHGLRTGLPSAGITMVTLPALVDAIHTKASKRVIVTLYACSTAGAPGMDRDRLEGDGGFADELRDALATLGHIGWIDAHTVPAHTTQNRMTRRFYLDGMGPGTGGAWLVAPGSPEWASWGRHLRAVGDPLRFDFPFLTAGDLYARLTG